MGLQDIDARVKWQGRQASGADKACGVLFLIVFAVHLIIGFIAWGNSNVILGNVGHCPEGWMPKGVDTPVCMTDDLSAEIVDCASSRRRLLEEPLLPGATSFAHSRLLQSAGAGDLNGGLSVFGLMSDAPEIPGTLIPCTVLVSVLWLGLLTYFSKPIVWATVLLKVACWFLVGVWMFQKEDAAGNKATESGGICFALGLVTLAVVVWKREAIHKAAEHLEMACVCVRKNISIFIATGIVQAVYIVYLLLFNLSLINGSMWWSVDKTANGNCEPKIAALAVNSVRFLSFGFMWSSLFFAGVSVVISSMITASWFWGQEDVPSNTVTAVIKSAVCSSLGTVAFGSLVTAITDFLQKQLRQCACGKMWWTNPWGCLLHCISKFLATLIETLTKFTLIIHAINGEPFFDAAKTCYAIMKKHFVNAVVTDQVGQHVLKLGAYVFSVALGFAAWGWADTAVTTFVQELNPAKYGSYSLDTLSASAWKDLGAEAIFYVFLVFYLILANKPMFTILFVGLVSETVHNLIASVKHEDGSKVFRDIQDPTTPFFVGVFIAAICSILFNFVANITLNVMDTIFLCNAIGKEKKVAAKGLDAEMQSMLSDLPQAKTEVFAGTLATGAPTHQQV